MWTPCIVLSERCIQFDINVQWIPLYWSTSIRGHFNPIKWLTRLSEVWLLCHRNMYPFLFRQSGPITRLTRLTSGPISESTVLSKHQISLGLQLVLVLLQHCATDITLWSGNGLTNLVYRFITISNLNDIDFKNFNVGSLTLNTNP